VGPVALSGFPCGGLYVILERTYVPEERAESLLAVCLEEGARAVQYRDKRSPDVYDLALLRRLAALSDAAGVPFLIDDHPDVAVRVGAHGVHLGRDDAPLVRARSVLGPGAIIGVSCYNDPERAREAVREGADYVAFGSFYPSRTKPGAVRATPEVLAHARPRISRPIVAIGGIDETNGAPLLASGADLLAVSGALFADPDPTALRARLRRFRVLFPPEGRRGSPTEV
jgi:thiamine-phosphate pyrophosphorylase